MINADKCRESTHVTQIYTLTTVITVSYMTYRPLNTTYDPNPIMSHIMNIINIFHL